MILSQFQRKDCVTEVMPVNDDFGRPHTGEKPHDYEGWDARRVLLHSQLNLICVGKGYQPVRL